MQETQVCSLIWEDPTCHTATKPMHHNYCTCALKPRNSYWPMCTRHCAMPTGEATVLRGLCTATRVAPSFSQLEKSLCSNEDPAQPKINKYNYIYIKERIFLRIWNRFLNCHLAIDILRRLKSLWILMSFEISFSYVESFSIFFLSSVFCGYNDHILSCAFVGIYFICYASTWFHFGNTDLFIMGKHLNYFTDHSSLFVLSFNYVFLTD